MQPREMGKQLLHLPVEGTRPQPIALKRCSLHPTTHFSVVTVFDIILQNFPSTAHTSSCAHGCENLP